MADPEKFEVARALVAIYASLDETSFRSVVQRARRPTPTAAGQVPVAVGRTPPQRVTPTPDLGPVARITQSMASAFNQIVSPSETLKAGLQKLAATENEVAARIAARINAGRGSQPPTPQPEEVAARPFAVAAPKLPELPKVTQQHAQQVPVTSFNTVISIDLEQAQEVTQILKLLTEMQKAVRRRAV